MTYKLRIGGTNDFVSVIDPPETFGCITDSVMRITDAVSK